MKKTLIRALSFFLTLSLLTGLLSPLAGAIEYEGVESITVDATAALLIDLDSDQVLYDQDADQQRYPASITKIMTALLTLEAVGRGELDLSTEVTVDAAALTDITDDSSTANLKAAIEGETYEFTKMYPEMIADAKEEGQDRIAKYFDMVNKVEEVHANLYKKALADPSSITGDLYVCTVCGYTQEGPCDKCPICGAVAAAFAKID